MLKFLSVDGLVKSRLELRKTLGFKHSVKFTRRVAVFKRRIYAQFVNLFCAVLGTARRLKFTLLAVAFYPASTDLIINATKLNELLMETV